MAKSKIKIAVDKHLSDNYDYYYKYARSIKNKYDSPLDIVQETIIYILEMSDDKLDKIFTYIDFYILLIIKRNTKSKTSSYQVKYNRLYGEGIVSTGYEWDSLSKVGEVSGDKDDSIDLNIDDIKDILNNECSLWEREVFLRYINIYKSFSKMSEDTKIPKASLYKAFNVAAEKIIEYYGKTKITRNNRKRKTT